LKNIVYIVRDEIVTKMDREVEVLSFIGEVLTVCDVKWARINMKVYDSLDNVYTILDVDYDNEIITLSPDGAYVFSGDVLKLTNPIFFVGTPIATNKEWGEFNPDERKKLPLCWMIEPTSERFNSDENSIERESDLRIVFLDSNNIEQWNTIDTHNQRLRAIYNMVHWFVESIKSNPMFYSSEMTYQTRNFTKFGKETSQGMEANIISANLTGVDLQITISVRREYDCNC